MDMAGTVWAAKQVILDKVYKVTFITILKQHYTNRHVHMDCIVIAKSVSFKHSRWKFRYTDAKNIISYYI